jgi:predicted GH43/DUF377 family glycosyl hydrolase
MNRHLVVQNFKNYVQTVPTTSHVKESPKISSPKDIADLYMVLKMPHEKKIKTIINVFSMLWEPLKNKSLI